MKYEKYEKPALEELELELEGSFLTEGSIGGNKNERPGTDTGDDQDENYWG